jgi:hypothetical protein
VGGLVFAVVAMQQERIRRVTARLFETHLIGKMPVLHPRIVANVAEM